MTAPRPILPHMPSLIKEKIIGKLDYDEKILLRRCSKEFQKLVNKNKTTFKRFHITSVPSGIKLNITEKLIEYEIKFNRDPSQAQTCQRVFQKVEPSLPNQDRLRVSRDVTHLLEKTEPIDALFAAIGHFFRNVERITIEKFSVDYQTDLHDTCLDFYESLQVGFSNMNGDQICVEHLEILNGLALREFLKIIPYFKPGTLQRFTFRGFFCLVSDKIRPLQQWQQAVCLDVRDGPRIVDLDEVRRFKFIAMDCWKPEDIPKFIRKAEEREEEFELLHITGRYMQEIIDNTEGHFNISIGDPRYRYKQHSTLNCLLRLFVDPSNKFLEIRRVASVTLEPTDNRFQDIS